MISLIVLRPQRFEAKPGGDERGRRIEADWHERIRSHDRHRTGLVGSPALEFSLPAGGTDTRKFSAIERTICGKCVRLGCWSVSGSFGGDQDPPDAV